MFVIRDNMRKIETKICTICGNMKSLFEFQLLTDGKYISSCKECKKKTDFKYSISVNGCDNRKGVCGFTWEYKNKL